VLSFVWLGIYTTHYLDVQPAVSTSEDGKTLTNGTVTPLHGPPGQVYHFTLEVHPNWTGTHKNFTKVNVSVSSVKFPGGIYENNSMILDAARSDANTSYYYYDTTVGSAVSIYIFWAEYPNGSVEKGAIWYPLSYSYPEGPISSDTGALILTLLPYSFIQTFMSVYVAFILIVGMIWWTRRARKMREQQIEKWKLEEAEKDASKPKSTQLKVPSRYKTTGTEKGAGETFVCSECGADVPAEATVCPNCGEKFD